MPTSTLTLTLFGPMRVLVAGKPIPRVRIRAAEWLLALLVLRHGRPVSRSWLAGTLWPESEETKALQNLRHALLSIRKALGAEERRLQSPTRDTLLLELEGAETDVVLFDQALREGTESALRRAIEVYGGPLLEGCVEEWVVLERESRQQACLNALETLADAAEKQQAYGDALSLLRRAEGMDGLRDTTQRGLMRVMAAAGDTPAALMAYRNFRLRVREEMNLEPDAETTALYQQILAEAREKSRASSSQERMPKEPANRPKASTASDAEKPVPSGIRSSSLPHPLTALIGREQEVEKISKAILASRLVTLVGGGGVGKTRLAIHIARKTGAHFAEGMAFVALAPLSDPALLPTFVASALGMREEAPTEPERLLDALAEWLSNRNFLLVLDNCEHLIEASAQFAQGLLQRCPHLHLLATSRQRLALNGEVVWRVPSLSSPNPGHLSSEAPDLLETVLEYPAVQLLVERAAMAHPGFTLVGPQEALAAARICWHLDGIPLAIELAAARIGLLNVRQIAARLDDRFRLLTGGNRDGMTRHQTLRALIDWSYNLLTPAERILLRHLSVFAGGWTLEAAEAVTDGLGHSSHDILDLMASLIDKSLVLIEEQEDGPRFRMLEMIRQYAMEKLREAGEEKEARRRTLEWGVMIAERAGQKILGPQPDAALGWLEAEQDNLREALTWAYAESVSSEMHLRLGAALWPFWETSGYIQEGRTHLRSALERRDLSDSSARAHCLLGASILSGEHNFFSLAIPWAQESLDRFRTLDEVAGVASALLQLGNLVLRVHHLGHSDSRLLDHAAARAMLTEALVLCYELGWVQTRILVLVHLGLLTQLEGDEDSSVALLNEGLILLEKEDDLRMPSYYQHYLSALAPMLSNHPSARAFLKRCLTLARKTAQKRRIAALLSILGEVAARQGDAADAVACFREVAQIHRDMGNIYALAYALLGVGNYHYQQLDFRSASLLYAESLQLFRKIGHLLGLGAACNNLGSALFHLGDAEQAWRLHREALSCYGGCSEGIAWSLERLGVLEALHGEPSRAAQILGAAAHARQEFGGPMNRWDQQDWDCAVAAIRAALSEQEFDCLFAAARGEGWEQAVEHTFVNPKSRE